MQMANKRISELPLLSPDNLNPSAAYIIVEQGGVTYKMPALGFGGASATSESLRDSKSSSLYAPSNETPTLTFSKTGINNTASAWSLVVVAQNSENGSRSTHGSSSGVSPVGEKKTLRINKLTNLDLINVGVSSYSKSSNTNLHIGTFHLTYQQISGKSQYYPFTKDVNYYVSINCSNADKIVLSFSSSRSLTGHRYYNNNPGKLGGFEWFAGIRANITATVEGTISA